MKFFSSLLVLIFVFAVSTITIASDTLERIIDNKVSTGLTNIGNKMFIDEKSLTSLAFTHENKNIYALECLNSYAGGTISWLKNNLGLIKTVEESEMFSKKEKDNNGVYLIPAFSGLGPPYWNSEARAASLELVLQLILIT